jgi:pimeloyl-ACP methyl ester carboxylesterase
MRKLDAGPGLREERVRIPDGRWIRVIVAGSGDPLVVFEAGIGVCASTWVTVQRLVAEQTRTLAYDRAGLGGSDNDAHPRSLERIVADLDAVLEIVVPGAAAVLVGASLGGPILRLLAETHPLRVAGLVLADAAVAEAGPDRYFRRQRRAFGVLAALSRIGLHTPLIRMGMKQLTDAPMPAADRVVLVRDLYSARNVRMGAREAREINLSTAMLDRLQAAGLPDVPVTTLVGELVDRRGSAELRAAMLDVGRREMGAHRHGRFVAATHSSHFIPAQEPGLVAEEILRIVQAVRAERASPGTPI